MIFQANWITAPDKPFDVCPMFKKQWHSSKTAEKATLQITALGVYEAKLGEERIGEYVLAPGWTAYDKRLQYQEYDITALLKEENTLTVTVGKGWYASPMPGWIEFDAKSLRSHRPIGLLAAIHIRYEDGSTDCFVTDSSWEWSESKVRFSEIYDGENYDAAFEDPAWKPVTLLDAPKDILIPQEGEEIREIERIPAKKIFTTPAGETVVDFGQILTGYVEFTVDASAGEKITILHGEVLDQKGNFYNANYRSAKAEIHYTCKEGFQTWHPSLTFFGFRYIKLVDFPGTPDACQFQGVVVCSNIKQTGHFACSNPLLNQLFTNTLWGQKGNFLDIPTDCPQRDERLGWTGDAQVFVKAATYNFDVEKFFFKWLHDMKADQRPDGAIGQVIPDYIEEGSASTAWGDAVTICPWQIYKTYGNPQILGDLFDSMKKWLGYIADHSDKPYLWVGDHFHFGDWLGLDSPVGSYEGSTRKEFIASAYYAYSTELVIRAGKVLGANVSAYEELHEKIVEAFRKEFPVYETQTEHVLAVHFHLAENLRETADALAALVRKDGSRLMTGFVGTPYLLHVLSDYGHADLAYTLLLREEYPSWLYPVLKGATTIWEHWDGIMTDGNFWSADMNSFNHYAYGAVIDWVYEKACGLQMPEEAAGFEKIRIAPLPDPRLAWMEASIDTRRGKVSSKWSYEDGKIRYDITTPVETQVMLKEQSFTVAAGTYTFWENIL